jgi:hypothetical protein
MLKDGRRLVNDWLMGPVSAKNRPHGVGGGRNLHCRSTPKQRHISAMSILFQIPDNHQHARGKWADGRHRRRVVDQHEEDQVHEFGQTYFDITS